MNRLLKRLLVIAGIMLLCPYIRTWAQLLPPNEAGVSMGHFGTIVKDVEATKRFWVLIGGTPLTIDGTEVIKFPGVFVFMTRGVPTGGSVGTTVDHPGFNIQDGAEFLSNLLFHAPGLRLEFNNLGFYLDNSDDLRVEILPITHYAQNRGIPGRQLSGPIVSDHIHFSFPGSAAPEALAWYVKTFGAALYSDGISTRNPAKPETAAIIPGVEMKFSKARSPSIAPTKGRALDHIGFEVQNLEAFCEKLESNGIKFDQSYSKSRHKSFASAELTDPWGTSIELTEGLNRF